MTQFHSKSQCVYQLLISNAQQLQLLADAEPNFLQVQQEFERAAHSPNGIQTPTQAYELGDLTNYARYTLRSTQGLDPTDPGLLAQHAEGSFVWLVMACLYVGQGDCEGNRASFRLQQVLVGDKGLDPYYIAVLGTGSGRVVRLHFLKLMLSSRDSLPLDALLKLPPPEYFPPDTDISEVRRLSSVISGVAHGAHSGTPVAPFHSSLVDFLCDARRSGELHIDPAELSKLRTLREAANAIADPNYVLPIIPALTPRNIELFVHQALRSLGPSCSADRVLVAHKAQGSLSWAAEACRAVVNPPGPVNGARVRLRLIASEGLNAFYQTILEECSDDQQLKGQMLLISRLFPLQTPLPLSSLAKLAFPPQPWLTGASISTSEVGMIVLHLAFYGPDSCHSSFWCFLTSPQRSGRFHININKVNTTHARLAEYCINIMDTLLRFNIADIPSSSFRNQDIPDIQHRIEANITPLLSYCCRFWPYYASLALQGGADIPSLAPFLENRTLQWLEIMSLIQSLPELALAPLTKIAVCICQ